MEPITATILIISALTSAGGAYMQMESDREQAKADRYMAEYNAKLAEREQAKTARESVERQEEIRKRGAAVQGTQRSLLAKGGVVLAEGSPLLLLADTAAEVELDIQREQYSAQERNLGLQAERSLSLLEADAAKARKKNATTTGWLNITTALTSGASDFKGGGGGKKSSSSSAVQE
jgi:hypothetical protein